MKNLVKIFLLIIIITFFYKCANQLPPPGGDVDKIPPEVLEVYPANGTLNFSDDYFEITFSEYVDKLSFGQAFFISPSIEKFKYDWSGRSVYISFEDTLKENTTYTVTIGTDVEDLNNRNKMFKAISFSFSTGDNLDEGEISGKIYDRDPSGVMLFAYLEADSFANPSVEGPDYISQVGERGDYKLQGLAPGNYRVFAVNDAFKDFLYSIGDDLYGVPSQEVSLTRSDSSFKNLNFLLTLEDTIPPDLVNTTMTDVNHILIEFSEYIDSSKINTDNFFIFDSTSNRRVDVLFLFKGKANDQQMFISLSDTLNEDGANFIIAENIVDNSGNITEVQSMEFAVNNSPDTSAANLTDVETEYEGNKVDFKEPHLILNFDDGFYQSDLEELFTMKDEKGDYPVEIEKIDDATIIVKINKELRPDKDYKMEIDLNKIIDASGNKIDSIHTINFSTISGKEFSGASGSVTFNSGQGNYKVVLIEVEGKNRKYSTSTENDNKFNFDKILPGQYLIWSYNDADSSGDYSFGSVYPFEHSEKFIFYPDTLNLRARWPVGDVMIR